MKQAAEAQKHKEQMEMLKRVDAEIAAEEARLNAKLEAAERVAIKQQAELLKYQNEVAILQAMDTDVEKTPFDWDGDEGWSEWEDVEALSFPVVGDATDLKLGQPNAESAYVRWRVRPFDKGTFRFAHKAQMKTRGKVTPCMVKFPIEPSKANDYAYFVEDAESSLIAREIGVRFNTHQCNVPRRNVEFIEPKILRFTMRVDRQYAAMEAFLPGTFLRFTNNMDKVSTDRITTVLAYGHFSWHYTRGNVMVVDLQGVKTEGGLLLTDPALHRRIQRGGHTDYGTEGMKLFFKNHNCNPICQSMGLDRHPAQSSDVDSRATVLKDM